MKFAKILPWIGVAIVLAVAGGSTPNNDGGMVLLPQPRELVLGNLRGLLEVDVADNVEAPLVVFLHGRDAGREQLRPIAGSLPPGSRRLFLEGPLGDEGGCVGDCPSRWYDPVSSAPDAELAAGVAWGADRVAAAIAEAAIVFPTSTIIVIGYSQGASIAYQLAATDRADRVLAIAGFLPTKLFPDKPTDAVVFAVHGANDANVSISRGRAAFDAFKQPDPQFITVPAGGHAFPTLSYATSSLIKELA